MDEGESGLEVGVWAVLDMAAAEMRGDVVGIVTANLVAGVADMKHSMDDDVIVRLAPSSVLPMRAAPSLQQPPSPTAEVLQRCRRWRGHRHGAGIEEEQAQEDPTAWPRRGAAREAADQGAEEDGGSRCHVDFEGRAPWRRRWARPPPPDAPSDAAALTQRPAQARRGRRRAVYPWVLWDPSADPMKLPYKRSLCPQPPLPTVSTGLSLMASSSHPKLS